MFEAGDAVLTTVDAIDAELARYAAAIHGHRDDEMLAMMRERIDKLLDIRAAIVNEQATSC